MKKGQVSLFIIIGIILLITVTLVIYFTQIQEERPLEKEAIEAGLPTVEADPVSSFVTSCLKITTINGLNEIGDKGGYIETNLLALPFNPTEGDAVALGKGYLDMKIPYWWHMTSPNTCTADCSFRSERPDLYSGSRINIEDQLKSYIEENINDCLSDFSSLAQLGYIVEQKSRPLVDVKIREKDVYSDMEWELEIQKDNAKYKVKDYATLIDLNMKEIYTLATELTNMESQYTFIENLMRNMIFSFSRKDKKSLPPVSDMTFEMGGTSLYWMKSKVGKDFTQALQTYVPALQVSGTKNFKFIAAPARARDKDIFEQMYNRDFLIPVEKMHPDLEVNFYYLDWWKPYFDLNCDGEICKPDNTGSNLLFSFAIQKYNFAYDLSIPIMVEISNPEALNGQGYSFRFMLEGNLRNNKPFTSKVVLPEPIETRTPSMFCDANQRNSGDITLEVRDYSTGELVEDAIVEYTCGEETCGMGMTTNDIFVSKFPRCLNGQLSLRKFGYETQFIPLTTDDNAVELKIDFYPEKEISIKTRRYDLVKNGNWKLDTSQFTTVGDAENLIIIFQKLDQGSSYSTVVDFSGDEEKTAKLLPGRYQVSFNGFSSEEFKLPKDRRCTKPEKFLGIIEVVESVCYYLPEEDMLFGASNPLPTTMMEYEIEINPDLLYNSNELILPYVYMGLSKVTETNRKIEDLSKINDQNNYVKTRQDLFNPVLR